MSRTFILASAAAVLIALTGTVDQALSGPLTATVEAKLKVGAEKTGHVLLEKGVDAALTEVLKYLGLKGNGEQTPAATTAPKLSYEQIQALRAITLNRNVIHFENLSANIKTPDGEQ
jgi:hypothetical protein